MTTHDAPPVYPQPGSRAAEALELIRQHPGISQSRVIRELRWPNGSGQRTIDRLAARGVIQVTRDDRGYTSLTAKEPD